MPTVLRVKGYRFFFYSHEPNEPPHVHVDKSGASVKICLEPVACGERRRRDSNSPWALLTRG